MPLHLAGGAKLELFPFNTSVFFVRLENLADDSFDASYKYYDDHENDTDTDITDDDNEAEDVNDKDDDKFIVNNKTSKLKVRQSVPYEESHPNIVDLDKLMTALVEKHLGGIVGIKLEIVETSLSGTELYHEMIKEKTQWTGYDDDYLDDSTFPRDKSERLISLEPQRIRMFRISIKPNVRPPMPPSNPSAKEQLE